MRCCQMGLVRTKAPNKSQLVKISNFFKKWKFEFKCKSTVSKKRSNLKSLQGLGRGSVQTQEQIFWVTIIL